MNKTAQEQFHKTKIVRIFEFTNISSPHLFLLLVKKLKASGIFDVTIKHVIIYKSTFNYQLDFLRKGKVFKTQAVKLPNNYLQLLDSVGELHRIFQELASLAQ